MSPKLLTSPALALIAAFTVSGCGGDEVKYTPRGAPSGAKAALPAVPNIAKKPIKQGEAYTVYGVSYYLRSRVHAKEVAGKKLSITGYITKTNLMQAPECAVHKGGKADPENCKPPVPTFWIGDTKDAPENESIKVMGWASNFAQLFDAIEEFDKGKENAEHNDTFWGIKTPNPLPAAGAKITVTGTYGSTFSQASAGAEADPYQGIMAYQEIQVLEQAPELATLPGVKRKERK